MLCITAIVIIACWIAAVSFKNMLTSLFGMGKKLLHSPNMVRHTARVDFQKVVLRQNGNQDVTRRRDLPYRISIRPRWKQGPRQLPYSSHCAKLGWDQGTKYTYQQVMR